MFQPTLSINRNQNNSKEQYFYQNDRDQGSLNDISHDLTPLKVPKTLTLENTLMMCL